MLQDYNYAAGMNYMIEDAFCLKSEYCDINFPDILIENYCNRREKLL